MRSCDPANRSPRADITSRVSSSQPPLILAWHCYSVAVARADAKAVTRPEPRRDNHRDRDVAIAIAGVSAVVWRKRSSDDRAPSRARRDG